MLLACTLHTVVYHEYGHSHRIRIMWFTISLSIINILSFQKVELEPQAKDLLLPFDPFHFATNPSVLEINLVYPAATTCIKPSNKNHPQPQQPATHLTLSWKIYGRTVPNPLIAGESSCVNRIILWKSKGGERICCRSPKSVRPWTVHHFIEKHVKHAVTSVQLDWEKFGLQKNIHVVSLVTQLIRTIQNLMFVILYLGPFTKQSTTLVRMSGCIHDYPCLWWDAHAPNILLLISWNAWMCFPGQQTSAAFIRLYTTYWMEQLNWTIGTISLYCTWLSAVALIPLRMY